MTNQNQQQQGSPFSRQPPFPGMPHMGMPSTFSPQQPGGMPGMIPPQGGMMSSLPFPASPNMMPPGMMHTQGMLFSPQMGMPRLPLIPGAIPPNQLLPGAIPMQAPAAPRTPSVEIGIPSSTVYVQNLDDRLNPKYTLVPALKKLFAPFGRVRRVTCKRSLLVKGQAWIEFIA